MAKIFRPQIDLTHAPTVERAIFDEESLYRIVIGPVGSGKTFTFISTEIMRIAMMQHVFPGTETSNTAGVRRSRFAIIRNTSPELKATTIKTWTELWDEEAVGPVVYSSPITHKINVPATRTTPGLEVEVMFLGLDRPADIAKLKSLEVTAVACNEISELPVEVVRYIRRRVGRFPPKRLGIEAVRPCVIGDSNAVDEDHWLAQMCDNPPQGFSFYRQPPAVLEVEKKGDKWICKEKSYPEHYGKEFDAGVVIDGAGRQWVVNPKAENLANLRKNYYEDQIAGATLAEIQRDLQAKWVYVQDGKPCIPGYNDDFHSSDDVPILKNVPLQIGIDIGGGTLNPAAIIAQRNSRGGWLVHGECIGTNMGVKNFVKVIQAELAEIAPDHEILTMWGDPAGEKGDEYYNTAVFDHLRRDGNFPVRGAPSQEIDLRIEVVESAASRWIDGKPALMINKRCKRLRKALSGGWHFRRMQVSGGEARYQDKPFKNHPDSDLGDAAGYLLLGGGEHRLLTKGLRAGQLPAGQTHQAKIDFDIFNQ